MDIQKMIQPITTEETVGIPKEERYDNNLWMARDKANIFR